jgi:hypothetical protein
MKIMLLIIFYIGIFATFYFFNKSLKDKDIVDEITCGSFTIRMVTSTYTKFNTNLRRIKETKVAYSVWFQGKEIQYSGPLQKNTGFSHLWRVYILKDAPTPTLIAGSQNLYLIHEQDGVAKVELLNAQSGGFSSLQFLDADNGQPSKLEWVQMASSRDSVQILSGGESLLVNQSLLLNVADLKQQPIPAMDRHFDGYYCSYNYMATAGAAAFSPDKKSLVFVGSKLDTNNTYTYAMIVSNAYTQQSYTVPFDLTDTRSRNPFYESREWFNTYFEWVKEKNGQYLLQLRKHEQLPYWSGYFKDEGKVFALSPVQEQLQPVFAEFIVKQLLLKRADLLPETVYSDQKIKITTKDFKIQLWYRLEEKVLLLMEDSYVAHDEKVIKEIHELGDAFNQELSRGKYQEYFTRF